MQSFLDLMLVIIMHRHRNHSLLLSEPGVYLLGGEDVHAGTKRISNLLPSQGREAKAITILSRRPNVRILCQVELAASGNDRIEGRLRPDPYPLLDNPGRGSNHQTRA